MLSSIRFSKKVPAWNSFIGAGVLSKVTSFAAKTMTGSGFGQ
jgi:hypothetical protein